MQHQVSEHLTLINGQVCASDKAIPVTHRALNYGDGVFETMRLIDGYVPLLPWHVRRLQKGAARLQLGIDADSIDVLFKQLLEHHLVDKSGIVKLVLARAEGGVAGYVCAQQSVDSFIQYIPLPGLANWYQSAVSIFCAPGRLSHNTTLAGLKHLSRLDYIVAAAKCEPTAEQELFFLDVNNHVVETMRHNIFCVLDGRLVTPPVDQVGVAGVMRQYILDHWPSRSEVLDVDISVKPMSFERLLEAEEIFLTNAVRGVVPVTAVDDRTLSQHRIAQSVAQMLSEKLVASPVSRPPTALSGQQHK